MQGNVQGIGVKSVIFQICVTEVNNRTTMRDEMSPDMENKEVITIDKLLLTSTHEFHFTPKTTQLSLPLSLQPDHRYSCEVEFA